MIKGMYISKAGLLPRHRKLEVTANNLANIDTIGYKKDRLFFRYLIDASEMASKNTSDESLLNSDMRTSFTGGPLRQTSNPLDLAIQGEGFFVIQTERGHIYTRNGSFNLNAEGRLVTKDGYSVLGSNGEIQIVGSEYQIVEDGTITVNGRAADRLQIVRFDDPQKLLKIGGVYFYTNNADETIEMEPEEINLLTGYLETSNVSGIEEVIEMIELYRQFEIGEKILTTQDHTLDKLINDTGRLG